MKKLFALLLATVMVLSFLPCAASADNAAADTALAKNLTALREKKLSGDDKLFLENLAKGIDARWAMADAAQDQELVEYEEIKSYYSELINAELTVVGSLSDYGFSDKELKQLAEEYVQGLNFQMESIEYIGLDYYKYIECYDKGYEYRAIAVSRISDKYDIPVEPANAEELKDFAADGKACIANSDFRNKLQEIIPDEPVLDVVSRYDMEEQYRSVTGVITLKNTTDLDLSGAVVDAKYFVSDKTEPEISSYTVSSFKPGESTEVKLVLFGKPENTEIRITAPCEKTSMEVSTDFVPVQFENKLHFDAKFENCRISYSKKDNAGKVTEYMYFDITDYEIEEHCWADRMYAGWIDFKGTFLWGDEIARLETIMSPGTQKFYINESDSKTVELELQLHDEAGNVVFTQTKELKKYSSKKEGLITRFFISYNDGVPSGNYTATLRIVSAK